MTLWLARHAQPVLAHGLCYGQTDVPADPQATSEAAAALAQALPPSVELRTSPLQRCLQLTRALQTLRPDLAATEDARLMEMHFGCWENVAWSDIAREALDAWTADFGNHRFGGVESANEVLARVGAALAEVQGDTVWITHAGVIRAASLLQRGIRRVDHAGQWPLSAPAFGQWLCL